MPVCFCTNIPLDLPIFFYLRIIRASQAFSQLLIMLCRLTLLLSLIVSLWLVPKPSLYGQGGALPAADPLPLVETITGNIRPKSIGHNGSGRFFAQNMMYHHSVTVYDRNFRLLSTITDEVSLPDYDIDGYGNRVQGAPVEVAFSPGGQYAYVANYKMYGHAFQRPGQDNCETSTHYDPGFIYEINTLTFDIERVFPAGAVPRYLAVSPDGELMLVANWCSGDVSIFQLKNGREIRRLPIGRHPRGIAFDPNARYAYIGMMGEARIAVVNLSDFTTTWIETAGRAPRHLITGPQGRFLYLALGESGEIAQVDVIRREVIQVKSIGGDIRSLIAESGGEYLYATDYQAGELLKLATDDLSVLSRTSTAPKPGDLTIDPSTNQLWVACYQGNIQIFEDPNLPNQVSTASYDAVPASHQASLYRPGYTNQQLSPHDYLYLPGRPQSAPQSEPDLAVALPPATPHSQPASDPWVSEWESPVYSQLRGEPAAGEQEPFFIVVGSFADLPSARVYTQRLARQGIQGEILSEQGRYRVSAGRFPDRRSAERALPRIQQQLQPDAWIYHP